MSVETGMRNPTLTTSYQLVHDGRTLGSAICDTAVIMANTDNPGPGQTATWPANTPFPLILNDTVHAKVASGTAVLNILAPRGS